MAAEHVLHMQKALDQMNLQIHRVLNDITGVSGLSILDAILAGERNPVTLARLGHGGVKSSEDTIAKSLEGDYRPEYLFALRQFLAAFRYYRQLVLESDREIQLQLTELETAATAQPTTSARTKANAHYARHYEPRTSDLQGELYRAFGVDQAALDVMAITLFDVIVSGMRMPGMDGLALPEQVRERYPFRSYGIRHNSKWDREDSQFVPESRDSSTASIWRDRRRVPVRGVVTRSGSRESWRGTTSKCGSSSCTDHQPAASSECDKTERSLEAKPHASVISRRGCY
jgi:CheY-like chemotaxis protein